jgi:hypothetical protein
METLTAGWPDWAIFCLLGDYFSGDNFLKTIQTSLASLIPGKSYALIIPKNELGYILGDFFTLSSGRPGWQ